MDPKLQNASEIRKEYVTYLVNLITPEIYHGFSSIYKKSVEVYNEGKNKKGNPKKEKLKIFKEMLKNTPQWNKDTIKKEAHRIKTITQHDWIEDLLMSAVKSTVVLLTGIHQIKGSKLLQSKFYMKVDYNEFIHKCYINCYNKFYMAPSLFDEDDIKPLDIRDNQKEIMRIINVSIEDAIKQMANMKSITREYLENNTDFEITSFDKNRDKHAENDFEKNKNKIKSSSKKVSDLFEKKDPFDQNDLFTDKKKKSLDTDSEENKPVKKQEGGKKSDKVREKNEPFGKDKNKKKSDKKSDKNKKKEKSSGKKSEHSKKKEGNKNEEPKKAKNKKIDSGKEPDKRIEQLLQLSATSKKTDGISFDVENSKGVYSAKKKDKDERRKRH